MGTRQPAEKLKARNLSQWQALADKYESAGLCRLCNGPMNDGKASEDCLLLGEPLEPYPKGRGYYAPVRPEYCLTCSDMVLVLTQRPRWVKWEAEDKVKRRNMGLDELGA